MKQEAPTGEGGHQRRCHDLRNGEEVTPNQEPYTRHVIAGAGMYMSLR